MAHVTYLSTLWDFEDIFFSEGGADIAFQTKTQKMSDFLEGDETLKSSSETDDTYISQFETAVGSQFVCVHVENNAIVHINEVEEPPLCVNDVTHKTCKDLGEGTIEADFKGLIGLTRMRLS